MFPITDRQSAKEIFSIKSKSHLINLNPSKKLYITLCHDSFIKTSEGNISLLNKIFLI